MRNAVIAFSMFASAAFAADPYIAYVYPVAVQAGTTNRIVVGGQGIAGVRIEASVAGNGVTVLGLNKVPAMPPPNGTQFKYLKGWLDSIAAGKREKPPLPDDPRISEWRECSWWRKLDELGDIELAIMERHLHVPRNSLQMSPSLRDRVILTVSVAPDAKPGLRELLLASPRGVGAPHALFVTASPHQHEPLYVPPHRRPPGRPKPTSVVSLPVVLDGQIMPGETDRFSFTFDKGARVRFALTAREVLPYIGDAVPGFFNPVLRLVDSSGREIAFADDDRFNPDPVMTVVVPSSGEYILEVRDNLYRGREDFVYMVEVDKAMDGETGARLVRRARMNAYHPPAAAGGDSSSSRFKGIVDAPGKSVKHEFDISEPGLRAIEMVARGAGSPLDPVVTLYGPKGGDGKLGPRLATWDDTTNSLYVGAIAQAECDPSEYYDFKMPGRYTIAVKDRVNAGGKGYFYSLVVRRPSPDFTVYCTRSSFPAHRGDSAKAKFRIVRRDGFDGEVKILDAPEISFKGAVIPAESNIVSVVAMGRMKDRGRGEIELFAEGLIDGKPVRRRIVPADEEEQAFAWTHLIPARTFFCTYVMRKPIPPRAENWPDLPDRLYADVQCSSNILFEVDVGASHDERINARSSRRLRGRRLVRARVGSDLKRWQMKSLVCDGVTEFDGADGEPIDDVYARRLMGVAQNASADNDVLVYAPTSHIAAAAAVASELNRQGWCADLLFENRVSAISYQFNYRIVFVPETVQCPSNAVDAILKRIDAVSGALVFEGNAPEWVMANSVELRGCRVCHRPNRRMRPRIVCGKCADALGVAWARREALNLDKGIRFSRWKDGDETLYFLFNSGKEKIAQKFKPSAKTLEARLLNPATGAAKPLKAKDGAIELSLAPGEAFWLRTYPYAAQ